MSLSLEDIKGELRENYLRTEEVLSGMDAYVLQLEKRLALLEDRIGVMEGAIYADDDPEPVIPASSIIVSR
jgi:hypothetical protein